MENKIPDDFDWKQYINNYPDLQEAEIDSKQEAIQHWINHGRNEGRSYRKKRVDIMKQLFKENPYKNFNGEGMKLDLQTWEGENKIFKKMIEKTIPKLIIEIGTWKGASAINMARHIKRKNLNCKILCIDTWLGNLEHWNKRDKKRNHHWYESLKLKNGYPQLYYQFLYNVIHNKLEDIIISFPTTSSIAFKWLEQRNIKPDLIYLDGSHETQDVYLDLNNYYHLLKNKGKLFGHDWKINSVRKAVKRFVNEKKLNNKLKLLENNVFWSINKNEYGK